MATSNAGGFITEETNTDNPENNPHFEIGQIKLKGNGGIIGSIIEGSDIGPININGGFGFLNSSVISTSDNLFAGITTTGFGIRDSTISGMSNVTTLDAQGTGNQISVAGFDPGVLLSAKDSVDPFFGTASQ